MRYVYREGEPECALIFKGCSVPIYKMVRVDGVLTDPNAVPPPESTPDDISTYSSVKLPDCNFSTRALNVLGRYEIKSVYDLLQYSARDLRSMKGLGKTTVNEIIQELTVMELSLSEEDKLPHLQIIKR